MRGHSLNPQTDSLQAPDDEPSEEHNPGRKALRPARLRQSARFQTIRNDGRWWSHRLLALGVIANDLAESRCGYSTSKKLGDAVERNRARRRMREAVRRQWPSVQPGWDIVFAGRQPLCNADFDEIVDAVGTLLRRAHVWRE